MKEWSKETEIAMSRMTSWLGVGRSKFFDWQKRYGKVNEHNAQVPRDHWLEEWERKAIIEYYGLHALDGYRRLTFMMLDEDQVAVSPSSVYRVLRHAGLLERWNRKKSKKGTGFVQPLRPHAHWHTDIAYLNLSGTFYYLSTILDGYSRTIIHWDIREAMKESDVEILIEQAREKFPGVKPRIISDNGPQYISRDFKEFIRLTGMTHVRTSPYYPQSNGKMERFFKTIKGEAIRPGCPSNKEEAKRIVEKFVQYYNERRLHSAIGYITPKDKLEGREEEIFAQRDRKLEEARARRAEARAAAHTTDAKCSTEICNPEVVSV